MIEPFALKKNDATEITRKTNNKPGKIKMMSKNAVKPEDILADKESFVDLSGVMVRKGSIAAFLKNIDVLEDTQSSETVKSLAVDMIKQLAPAIVASGLSKHAVFRNSTVQEILLNTELQKRNIK